MSKFSFAETLPDNIKERCRCQILDDDGNRCRRKARYVISIYEDANFDGRWFVVNICRNHLSEHEAKEVKQLEATP